MKTKFCPDCVVALEPHRRKQGVISRWLKCPKCGLVQSPNEQEAEDPTLSQKIIENNINQINKKLRWINQTPAVRPLRDSLRVSLKRLSPRG